MPASILVKSSFRLQRPAFPVKESQGVKYPEESFFFCIKYLVLPKKFIPFLQAEITPPQYIEPQFQLFYFLL